MIDKSSLEKMKEVFVERDLMKSIFISLISSFLILTILYLSYFRYSSDFISSYGYYIFFAILSYSVLFTSIYHVSSFKQFPCMSGMMIGMTIGMIAGFLAGFFVGATNGMFWGSVFGMAVGIFFGIYCGKCCGVMGFMEGTMAGFMGGLMGAMTALMMFNDNLLVAGIISFIISCVILLGFNYMVYTETKVREKDSEKGIFFLVFWNSFLTFLTIIFMVFGPRSVLLQ